MFDWIENLELAHELSEQNSERNQRSAISRAYYAVFCSCRNWLVTQEPDTPISKRSSVHQDVPRAFRECEDDDQKRKIGELLMSLRRRRNRADYDDEVPDLARVLKAALKEADELRDLLQVLQSSQE